jgi:hypothetical protein
MGNNASVMDSAVWAGPGTPFVDDTEAPPRPSAARRLRADATGAAGHATAPVVAILTDPAVLRIGWLAAGVTTLLVTVAAVL